MVTQKSDIKNRRRKDSEILTINKKRKHEDQEDHLDELQEDPSTTISNITQQDQNSRLELILLETDMTSTIQFEVNKQPEKKGPETNTILITQTKSVENEIFSKYVLEEMEIDGTEEQQVNDETRNKTIVQEKILY
ncbi:32824_t:CDS:2, partial [Gigaspora margarita]